MPTLYEQELLDYSDDPHTLLNPKEAARLLAVNVQTLRNWSRDGKIRFVRTVGGHRRYPLSVVKAIMNGQSQDDIDLPGSYT